MPKKPSRDQGPAVELSGPLAEVYFRQGDRERALATLRKAKAAADDPEGAIQEIEVHFRKLFPDNTL